jgi:hypothetical protein
MASQTQPLPNAAPRLSTFAVCDDIRTEQGGKLTVVGLYGKAIRIATLPATLPKLCFLAEFDSPFLQATTLRVRLINPSGNLVFETPVMSVPRLGEDPLIPQEYRQARVVFQVAPMIANEGGAYAIEYEFPGWPLYRQQFFVAADPALVAPRPTDAVRTVQ